MMNFFAIGALLVFGATMPAVQESKKPVIASKEEKITDNKKFFDEFFGKPLPSPKDQFETTKEYQERVISHTDTNKIFVMEFDKSVLDSVLNFKKFEYDSDRGFLSLFMSNYSDKNDIVAFNLYKEENKSVVDCLRIFRFQTTFFSKENVPNLGDFINDKDFDVKISREIPLKFVFPLERAVARVTADKLKVRIGFKIPDPMYSVKEEREFFYYNDKFIPNKNGQFFGENDEFIRKKFYMRCITAKMIFIEVFNSDNNKIIKRFMVSQL